MYSSAILTVIVALIGVPMFFYLHKTPTCFDGIKDGDETGVDCGGSCKKLCLDSFLVPQVAWTRIENVAPGVYNIGTYIINPNPTAIAPSVPYHVVVYDDRGVEITEYSGTVTLPPQRNTLAFDAAVSTGKRVPAKALFEFTDAPQWQTASDPLSALAIGDKDYTESSTSASLSVTINNTSVDEIGGIDVYAVLYDKDGNTLGFSKTALDRIPAQGSAIAPFTWPTSFGGRVISIEVLPVAQ
jgi:hypothetical protein